MHKSTMIRSRVTGRKHRLSPYKSHLAKISHRQFKHHKRPLLVKQKISRQVKKVFRTGRTTTGLKLRTRRK